MAFNHRSLKVMLNRCKPYSSYAHVAIGLGCVIAGFGAAVSILRRRRLQYAQTNRELQKWRPRTLTPAQLEQKARKIEQRLVSRNMRIKAGQALKGQKHRLGRVDVDQVLTSTRVLRQSDVGRISLIIKLTPFQLAGGDRAALPLPPDEVGTPFWKTSYRAAQRALRATKDLQARFLADTVIVREGWAKECNAFERRHGKVEPIHWVRPDPVEQVKTLEALALERQRLAGVKRLERRAPSAKQSSVDASPYQEKTDAELRALMNEAFVQFATVGTDISAFVKANRPITVSSGRWTAVRKYLESELVGFIRKAPRHKMLPVPYKPMLDNLPAVFRVLNAERRLPGCFAVTISNPTRHGREPRAVHHGHWGGYSLAPRAQPVAQAGSVPEDGCRAPPSTPERQPRMAEAAVKYLQEATMERLATRFRVPIPPSVWNMPEIANPEPARQLQESDEDFPPLLPSKAPRQDIVPVEPTRYELLEVMLRDAQVAAMQPPEAHIEHRCDWRCLNTGCEYNVQSQDHTDLILL